MSTDAFNVHGLLATTYAASPGVIVNGPVARAIGMNAGLNALGQGNRANATIGRALQLVERSVGGGRPGAVDRATLGQPGKYTCCFAEDEAGSPWEPLAVERGLRPSAHPKRVLAFDALVVVAPEHARVFRDAGWTKARLREEIHALLTIPGEELARGAGGCAEGMPDQLAGTSLPKFRPDGVFFVPAGGPAGLFSTIIGGWGAGYSGSRPATREVAR